ncbi:type VII secretion target [Saccharomonospora piscinae]|uniref:type VII secretion target n=1 Tax=Saccharomonospora piscinae TaxID=687388 RepID=UPI0004659220|nr:type VII secretion target [Saccharomonospora piscinae]
MSSPHGYTIDPDELFSHARAVAQLQQPIDRLVAATDEAAPIGLSLAYGTNCQSFGLALDPAEQQAKDTARALSDAVDAAARSLTDAVDRYVRSEEQTSHVLREIGKDLPPDAHNDLIATGTSLNPMDYHPGVGSPWTNIDDKNGFKGGGIAGNIWDLKLEIENESERNYGEMMGQIASVGADAAGFAGDPLGTGVSWLAGWAMEHLKPFKIILDGLAGNPDVIQAASKTWKRVGDEWNRLAEHYTRALQHGAGGWDGAGGDAYRDTANTIIEAMKATANLAHTMSIIVGATGDLVNCVRNAARDLTAQAAGKLAVYAAKSFYKPPFEALSDLRFHLKNLKTLVSFLVVLVNHFGREIPLVIEAYKTVATIVPKLNGT